MNKIYKKEEVLEFIKKNKEVMFLYFIKGDFNIYNEEHLKVFHEFYTKNIQGKTRKKSSSFSIPA